MSRQLRENDLFRYRGDTSQLALVQNISLGGTRFILRDSSGAQSTGHVQSNPELPDRQWWYDDRVKDINNRGGKVLNISTYCTLSRSLPDGRVEHFRNVGPREYRHTLEHFRLPWVNSIIIYRGYVGRCETITADNSAAIIDSWWAEAEIRDEDELPPLRVPMEAFRNQQAVPYPFWKSPASPSNLQHISHFSFPVRIGMEMLFREHLWIVTEHCSIVQVEWEDGSVSNVRGNSLEPVQDDEPRVGARLMDVVFVKQGGPGHIIRVMTGFPQLVYVVRLLYEEDKLLCRENFFRMMYNDGESKGDDGCFDSEQDEAHDEPPDLASLDIGLQSGLERGVDGSLSSSDFGPLTESPFLGDEFGECGEFSFDE